MDAIGTAPGRGQTRSASCLAPWLAGLLSALLCALLGGCGGGHGRGDWASRSYSPPGAADDPWGPYIAEASGRFSVPDPWIRAVMHQESGGHQYIGGRPVTSPSGAMGLMQLMPATYAELEQRYGLGSDPYDPHDNIVAGTGYIRQLYDKYGSPGFLAAYNAGPGRLDDYLVGNRSLPDETIDYVNAISPHLGDGRPGAAGGGAGVGVAYASASRPSHARHGAACVQAVDAAYDPSSPCAPAPSTPNPVPTPNPVTLAAAAPIDSNDPAYLPADQQIAAAGPRCPGDPDAAFDAPCPSGNTPQTAIAAATPPAYVPPSYAPPSYAAASSAGLPGYRGRTMLADTQPSSGTDIPPYAPMPAATPHRSPPPGVLALPQVTLAAAHATQLAQYGGWAIQVGAFDSPAQARTATAIARQTDYARLGGAQSVVQAVAPAGRATLYRARLAGLARQIAGSACADLGTHGIACMVVPPGG